MIQFTDTHSLARADAARLGPNHGYRIEGDIALLHADIAVSSTQRSQWALQLWACERPFSGGTLQGVKVAEAALPLADAVETQRLDAEALARVPGGQRDYSMVLVLASGSNGAFDQIHDFANYPARERFITPHLDGSVGYQIDGSEVVLRADGIRNPRAADNLSGSLALELWGVTGGYHGGPVEDGALLASADVGRIAGESTIVSFEQRAKFNPPAAGRWNVVLMLREWAPGGYVTRDFCTFARQYEVADAKPASEVTRDAQPTFDAPTRDAPTRDVQPARDAPNRDAQPTLDTSSPDAQPMRDAQPTLDTSSPDAQSTLDISSPDAQPMRDAQPTLDTSSPDAQSTLDISSPDAQPMRDAHPARDAPSLDAERTVATNLEAPKAVEALRVLVEPTASAETIVLAPELAGLANATRHDEPTASVETIVLAPELAGPANPTRDAEPTASAETIVLAPELAGLANATRHAEPTASVETIVLAPELAGPANPTRDAEPTASAETIVLAPELAGLANPTRHAEPTASAETIVLAPELAGLANPTRHAEPTASAETIVLAPELAGLANAMRHAEPTASAETIVLAPELAGHTSGARDSAVPRPLARAVATAAQPVKPAAIPVAHADAAIPTPAVSDAARTASVAHTNGTSTPADGLVSIMRSSVEEIAQLKGLTRKIAVEVVKGRPYASLDELTRVRGIGPKLLAKLRGQITL